MSNSYYAPYESDNELLTDEESGKESEEESDGEDERVRREQDPRFAIQRISGPNFNKPSLQIQNSKKSYQEWDKNTDIYTYKDHVYLDPPKTVKTSLISIKSINRDRNVFPTPYNFQLKLPRVYKNVTKFQLVQMSFPNPKDPTMNTIDIITNTIKRDLILAGVPSSCISTCIGTIDCTSNCNSFGLIEIGRTNTNGNSMMISLSLSEQKKYTPSDMANELTFKANSTPPFNIISYDEFRDIFMNTRDIGVLFNEPGDSFYSNISNIRMGGHSKQHIINVYYNQFDIDRYPIITEKIAFNAYYYPILKEAIATQRAEPFIQTGNLTYSQVVEVVLSSFDGLDSDIYYQLCNLNRQALDIYRKNYTFEHRNINKYIFSYNEYTKQSNITHTILHPSLQKEFNNRLNLIKDQQIRLAGLATYKFSDIKNKLITDSSIYKHLELNLSTILGNYHFVTNYKYNGGMYHSTLDSTFHAISDLYQDSDFNSIFSYTSCIGGIYNNYSGLIMNFTNFLDYHSTLSSYYNIIQSTSSRINYINDQIYSNYHYYISTKYTNILPDKMIQNKSYLTLQSVPVSIISNEPIYIPGQEVSLPDNNSPNSNYSLAYDECTCLQYCCSTLRRAILSWYSCLPTNLVINTLQYRLGLNNITPNQINILSTVANITSTGNVNLFMQVNEEQGFNNMDITMPENYNITNDTTGQVKMFCAKILMGDIGSSGISQTVIQNPSIFDTPLGKLDKLNIKIFYDDQTLTPAWLYQPYYLDLTEWDATYQIDEEVGYANRQTGWGSKPTIQIPDNPDNIQYLGITHKNNPNNS
jgi:hypothetical protein